MLKLIKDLYFITCKICGNRTFTKHEKGKVCEGCKYPKIKCRKCKINFVGPTYKHKLVSFCMKCYSNALKEELNDY